MIVLLQTKKFADVIIPRGADNSGKASRPFIAWFNYRLWQFVRKVIYELINRATSPVSNLCRCGNTENETDDVKFK